MSEFLNVNGNKPIVRVLMLKGEKGEKGDNGAAAAAGKDATITVGTVTTGDTASVTNSGTKTDAVLNFVIPKGEKGDKGDRGDSGSGGSSEIDGVNLLSGTYDFSSSVNKIALNDASGNETDAIGANKYNGLPIATQYCEFDGTTITVPNEIAFKAPDSIVAGEYYTLSFYAKIEGGGGTLKIFSSLKNDSNNATVDGSADYGRTESDITSEWKRYSVTWKAASPFPTTGNNVIYPASWGTSDEQTGIGNTVSDYVLYIAGVKFEHGKTATDWTPSISDVLSANDMLAAAVASSGFASGTLSIARGGTGATTAEGALTNLGIADMMNSIGNELAKYKAITIGTTAAPTTGTANTIYIQLV